MLSVLRYGKEKLSNVFRCSDYSQESFKTWGFKVDVSHARDASSSQKYAVVIYKHCLNSGAIGRD